MTSANSMHEVGHSKPVFWDNSEGWGWEEGGSGGWDGGKHVHPWLIHVDAWWKSSQYCKMIIFQFKKKAAKEKQQVTYKEKPIGLTANLLAETLQAKRDWQDIFKVLK